MCPYNLYQNPHALKRFKDMVQLWRNVCDLGPTILIWDINIVCHAPNDPVSREELRDLIPVLEEFKDDLNVTLVNKEPTRHHCQQRSSLLDLILTTTPLKLDNISNIRNPTSDHDGVQCYLHLNDIVTKPQFFVTRDMRLMTFKQMEPLVLKNKNLQEVFQNDDPNEICSRLLLGLNEVADSVSELKKKQIRKKKHFTSLEAER